MALTLPFGRGTFLPQIPADIDKSDPTVMYLKTLHTDIEDRFRKHFDNVAFILNTGTSGTFIDSLGNTVTVESGIITGLA